MAQHLVVLFSMIGVDDYLRYIQTATGPDDTARFLPTDITPMSSPLVPITETENDIRSSHTAALT